jgi:hypothetical protein
MPPKPKPKPKEDAPVESTAAPSMEETQAQLQKEKQLRNYFQLERDRINNFWEITKKELETLKAELRNKDREMEELEERHQVELKVYKQKVRHLLYEQKITIDRLKIESENALKMQADEFKQKHIQLKADKRNLKREMKMMELSHEETIKALKLEQDKNITYERDGFSRQLKEIQLKYDVKMKKLREDLEHRAKKESEEIEERKNTHIRELMKKHELAFVEIRNYYNNITTNNLVLIKTLKDDAATMKKNEAINEKLMFEIAEDNKRLSEPLVVALGEVNQLRHELANYNKDKLSLKEAKKRLVQFEEQLKNLKWEHEILEQSHANVQQERDELYQKFERTIHDVQKKTTFKNQLLETKVGALHETIEKKDAQLREIMKVSKLDENTLGSITSTMEDVIEEKNKQIRDLQFDCEKLKKAHNDLVRTISDKLQQYGIPPEELGMRTVFPSNTTSAPAGLV